MPRRTIILAVLLILLSGAAIAVAAISENTGVAIGTTQSITGPTAGGGTLCKKVTNNSPTGKQLYVPGSTAAEWQSFVANPPSGVGVATCQTCGTQTFSSSGTWTNNPACPNVVVQCWGGGGGGSAGAGPACGAGGGGGAYNTAAFDASSLSSSVVVTVGASGAGGAGAVEAGSGGVSSFGTYLYAYGGGGGLPYSNNSSGPGGGGGQASIGESHRCITTTYQCPNGGGPSGGAGSTWNGSAWTAPGNSVSGGGGAATGLTGGSSTYGGGGGSSCGAGGNSVYGGGGGGGTNTSGGVRAGGSSTYGGSGGASNPNVAGSPGAVPGGGGGGGSSSSFFVAGSGGAGAAGQCIVTTSSCGGSYTISSNQVNLNLFSYAGSPSCTNGSYTFTINSGVVVGSNSTALPALTTGTWPSGTTLALVNNGKIYGKEGAGADVYETGYPGGPAFSLTSTLSINNANGNIYGGGGGGGNGGPVMCGFVTSYGGMGGAGQGYGNQTAPQAGSPGSVNSGAGDGACAGVSAGAGGTGGTWGSTGQTGYPGDSNSAGTAGGSGGASILRNGYTITWLGGNDATHVKGAIQ